MGLDKDDNIIGYKYCNTGKMMENIKRVWINGSYRKVLWNLW